METEASVMQHPHSPESIDKDGPVARKDHRQYHDVEEHAVIAENQKCLKRLTHDYLQYCKKYAEVRRQCYSLRSQLWSLNSRVSYCMADCDRLLDHLQEVLHKLSTKNQHFPMLHRCKCLAEEKSIIRHKKPSQKCEGGLNLTQVSNLISYLQDDWHICSKNKASKEHICKQIERLNELNEKATAHAAEEKAIQEPSHFIKFMNEELKVVKKIKEELKKELVHWEKDRHLLKSLRNVGHAKRRLQKKSDNICDKCDEAERSILGLKKKNNQAVDKFMSGWNNIDSFRKDDKEWVWASLDGRGLSRDGRLKTSAREAMLTFELLEWW